jgi:hypothetical protein
LAWMRRSSASPYSWPCITLRGLTLQPYSTPVLTSGRPSDRPLAF